MPIVPCSGGTELPKRLTAALSGTMLTPCVCMGEDIALEWNDVDQWRGSGWPGCDFGDINISLQCRPGSDFEFLLKTEMACGSSQVYTGSLIFPVSMNNRCCEDVPPGSSLVTIFVTDEPVRKRPPPQHYIPCDCTCPEGCAPQSTSGPGGPQAPGSNSGGPQGRRREAGGPQSTPNSVRYISGEMLLSAVDLQSNGAGVSWGHTRSFSNRLRYSDNLGNGNNWQVREWTGLSILSNGSVSVMGEATRELWFTKVGTSYVGDFGRRETMQFDTVSHIYRFQDLAGNITEYDSRGNMLRRTAAGGDTLEVVSMLGNGFNATEVQRSSVVGGVTTVESFLYQYVDPDDVNAVLASVTLRRKVDAGDWFSVARARYTYYTGNDTFGGSNDLQVVTTENWNGDAWVETGSTLYRYYKANFDGSGGSSSSSGSSTSSSSPDTWYPDHQLKFAVLPAAHCGCQSADILDSLLFRFFVLFVLL